MLANYQGSLGAVSDVSILCLWVGKLNQRKLKLSGSELCIIYLHFCSLPLLSSLIRFLTVEIARTVAETQCCFECNQPGDLCLC